MPIPLTLDQHYGRPPESYWSREYLQWNPAFFGYQIKQFLKLARQPGPFRALDIGSGLGHGLRSLEAAGIAAVGLEPSAAFYERALQQPGIHPGNLLNVSVENAELPEESFDLITFGAVLEHLYCPATALKACLAWLKPQGLIHLEVPSSDWFIGKLVNFYYRSIGTTLVTNLSPMHPPYHLYEFTACSFEKLSLRLGLTVEQAEISVGEIMYAPKFLHRLFRAYMEKTKSGMQLTVWLRKSV